MKLHFDTNVFNWIAETGEALPIRDYLTIAGHELIATGENLFEAFAAPEPVRQGQIGALTAVATRYQDVPIGYVHAQEVLEEVRRVRPDWLFRIPQANRHSVLLNRHRRLWREAKVEGDIPKSADYAGYHEVAESMSQLILSDQKNLRDLAIKVKGKSARENVHMRPTYFDEELDALTRNQTDVEFTWRMDSDSSWAGALFERRAGSRDYLDWVVPYLRLNLIRRREWARFWLSEVNETAVPFNRVSALTRYYQLWQKVTHGNPVDIMHANYLLTVDALVTADKSFGSVLGEVSQYLTNPARTIVLDRGGPSAFRSLQHALG